MYVGRAQRQQNMVEKRVDGRIRERADQCHMEAGLFPEIPKAASWNDVVVTRGYFLCVLHCLRAGLGWILLVVALGAWCAKGTLPEQADKGTRKAVSTTESHFSR